MSPRWQPFREPWVIAHRGASGILPEHTLPGYALAIEQGADVIEPDLLASADGVLYARHDLGLARSTDVASHPEFAARRRAGDDGVADWWISDFHAQELDRLRAIQPWPGRPHHRDGCFRIPRFGEVLDLLLQERARRDRPLLIYPELKHPEHYVSRGIDVVELFAKEVLARGLTGSDAPVWVQCFDAATLGRVRERTGLPVVLLSVSLPDAAADVDGFGVSKQALLGDPDGAQFIREAHARGKRVHAWTFRDDQPVPGREPAAECAAAFAAGCDALFSDFPATALAGRKQWRRNVGGLRIECVRGAAIAPFLPALAALRIRVFRDWPYLYDGDLDYEAEYLKTYSRSPRSLFVLAFDGDTIVGCSTAVPLADENPEFQAPFVAAGIPVADVYYFGESVLDHAYRGRGLGHRFFDAREAQARELGGFAWTAFCAVQRDANDPRRPPGYRPLDEFWRARGYVRRPDLVTTFDWKEVGDAAPSSHPMLFWLRACG